MRRLLWVVACLVSTCIVHADEYWAVGSFGNSTNAEAERARIERVTGMSVEVTYDREAQLYRVLIAKDNDADSQRQFIDDAGLSVWTFHGEGDRGLDQAAMTPANQEGPYLLVVAGFQDSVPAQRVADSMMDAGLDGVAVMRTTVDGGTYYRVVLGPHASKDETARRQLMERGYDGVWWLTVDAAPVPGPVTPVADLTPRITLKVPTVEAESRVARLPAEDVAETPVEATMPSGYRLEAPKPGQTYLDYCVAQANQLERAVYCSEGSFNDLVVADRRIVDRVSALLEFCALRATATEREVYCGF